MDECIRGAHVSYHFLWGRIFQVASDLPWSLVRGDIEANVLRLGALEHCPDEPMSAQLWQLQQIGHPVSQLVGAVRALGESGWTSVPAEQQHGSLAVLHKWHPDYSSEMLISRGLMLQVSRILPSISKEEKERARVCRHMDTLMRSNPDRCSGKSMLFASMVDICKGRHEEGRPGYTG